MKLSRLRLLLSSIPILIAFFLLIIWAFNGFELFSKNSIAVEQIDPITNQPYYEWKDKFVFGLIDFVLPIILASIIIFLTIYYILKRRFKNEI